MDVTKHIGDQTKIKALYEIQKNIADKNPKKDAYLKRMRGYELEKLIYTLLYNEKIDPWTAYAHEGEQIDGSFRFNDLHFLIEAKWHTKPTEACLVLKKVYRLIFKSYYYFTHYF